MGNSFFVRFLKLQFGLFLYGLGITICLQAQIGYAPWDIFHVGVSLVTGMSVGRASILIGFLILVIVMIMRERLGIGSLFNMVVVGLHLDLILRLGIVPQAGSFPLGVFMMALGVFTICTATVFYIASGFGAGPRDSLMVALHRRLGIPIGAARALIETSVTLLGWRMGGMLGIGTILSVLFSAVFIQIVFRLFHFDPKTVRHESLPETTAYLRGLFSPRLKRRR